MIELYANQVIGWRMRTGIKDNGAPIYDPAPPASPAMIRGLVETRRRLVRNEKGEQVLSDTLAVIKEPVNEGDALVWQGREWPVLAVKIVYGLTGAELHREVSL